MGEKKAYSDWPSSKGNRDKGKSKNMEGQDERRKENSGRVKQKKKSIR